MEVKRKKEKKYNKTEQHEIKETKQKREDYTCRTREKHDSKRKQRDTKDD